MTDAFMKNAERAARLMEPHVAGLTEGKTAYEKAHALFSIVEQASLALDDGRFWQLFSMHIAGDREGFDALLNEVLGV